jgi:hypothetical protein
VSIFLISKVVLGVRIFFINHYIRFGDSKNYAIFADNIQSKIKSELKAIATC